MDENKKIKVIIIDDHELIRTGLGTFIKNEDDLTLIAEASDGNEGYEKIKKLKPDVAVIDIEMPGMDGLRLSKLLKKENIKTEIVILTSYSDEAFFLEAMDIGISAYVLKESKAEELINAIKLVYNGDTYLSPKVHKYLIERYKKRKKIGGTRPGIDELTLKEINVIKLVAENKSNKEMATELYISPKTVETHRYNICKKLNLKGNHSLLIFALQNKHFLN